MDTSSVRRPSLIGNPETLIPKMESFNDEPMDLPEFRPTRAQKRQSIASACFFLLMISAMWLVVDGLRHFPFWVFVVLALDAVYLVFRLPQFRSMGMPKLPVLYLPFTTLWGFSVTTPTMINAATGPVAWMSFLAATIVLSSVLLGRRLIHGATDQEVSDPRVSEEFAHDFRKAQRNPTEFRSGSGRFLLDPPNHSELRLIDVERFQALINSVLGYRLWRPFAFLAVLLLPFIGHSYLPLDGVISTDVFLRWYWPAIAISICLLALFSLVTRRGRKRFSLTILALRLFANSLRFDKNATASWTPHHRYGHRQDRVMYLELHVALATVLLAQLLVVAPIFLQSPSKFQSGDYPDSGIKVVTLTANAEHWFEWNDRKMTEDTAILWGLCYLPLPPLCQFLLLVLICGERLRRAHELFSAENSPTHESYAFDFGERAQERKKKKTKKRQLAKKVNGDAL